MPTEEAYIEGFVKRAAEYGYNQEEALYLFKEAGSSWRTMGANIRKKLYSVLKPKEQALLNLKQTHPYGADAGRIRTVAESLRRPGNEQVDRVRSALKSQLKAHQSGQEVYTRPDFMENSLQPRGLLDKLKSMLAVGGKAIRGQEHTMEDMGFKKLLSSDIKKKMKEVGSLYSKPNLP